MNTLYPILCSVVKLRSLIGLRVDMIHVLCLLMILKQIKYYFNIKFDYRISY